MSSKEEFIRSIQQVFNYIYQSYSNDKYWIERVDRLVEDLESWFEEMERVEEPITW